MQALDLNINLADWQVAIEETLIHPPGVWFIANMTWCAFSHPGVLPAIRARYLMWPLLSCRCFLMCYALKRLMGHLSEQGLGFQTIEAIFNMKIDVSNLAAWL
eukprot:SAG11_NODE_5542_length_1531_cov_1.185754_3_plen_102_part_01